MLNYHRKIHSSVSTGKVLHSRRAIGKTVFACAAATAGVLLMAAIPFHGPQAIPTDPQLVPDCNVSAATFAGWFQSGAPTLNGEVKPANSVTFPNVPNGSFYQWSNQMFLWLTSPTPARYGGGRGRIFSSPAFYDVSPPNPNTDVRNFIPHVNGVIRTFNLRMAQLGPHKLPVIVDKRGQLFELSPPKFAPSGKQLLLNGRTEIEIQRVTISPNRKLIFQDKTGKTLSSLKPILRAELNPQFTAQKIMVNRKPVFLDSSGNVIDTEEGQADGGALLAQNGSLVYYATMVNDVYAYFLTGAKDGGILPAPTQFPTTQADLDKITTFASAHGKTFPDPEALAVEIKTSWIEATGLPNLANYITMRATIPTYDKSNPDHWVANGQKTAAMALVGMHVVGSTKGHPEMIWATFEHIGNAPNAAYSYNATMGPNPKTVPQTTAGTWQFCTSNATGPFNVMHQFAAGADIQAQAGFHITPSDVRRDLAWGNNTASSNTEILTINDSVRSKIPVGDVRGNYFMTGATWTIFGAPPSPSNQVGTNKLSNTTMETFQPGSNCFSCHTPNTTTVSHVYDGLTKLF